MGELLIMFDGFAPAAIAPPKGAANERAYKPFAPPTAIVVPGRSFEIPVLTLKRSLITAASPTSQLFKRASKTVTYVRKCGVPFTRR